MLVSQRQSHRRQPQTLNHQREQVSRDGAFANPKSGHERSPQLAAIFPTHQARHRHIWIS